MRQALQEMSQHTSEVEEAGTRSVRISDAWDASWDDDSSKPSDPTPAAAISRMHTAGSLGLSRDMSRQSELEEASAPSMSDSFSHPEGHIQQLPSQQEEGNKGITSQPDPGMNQQGQDLSAAAARKRGWKGGCTLQDFTNTQLGAGSISSISMVSSCACCRLRSHDKGCCMHTTNMFLYSVGSSAR